MKGKGETREQSRAATSESMERGGARARRLDRGTALIKSNPFYANAGAPVSQTSRQVPRTLRDFIGSLPSLSVRFVPRCTRLRVSSGLGIFIQPRFRERTARFVKITRNRVFPWLRKIELLARIVTYVCISRDTA